MPVYPEESPDSIYARNRSVEWVRQFSFPLLCGTHWRNVSRDAHTLYWDINPRQTIATRTGMYYQGLCDRAQKIQTRTEPVFVKLLQELREVGAIDFWRRHGMHSDGTRCRIYFLHFCGIEHVDEHKPSLDTILPALDEHYISKTRRAEIGRRNLIRRFNATCVYCKRQGTFAEDPDGRIWHGDHVWAKAQGGKGNVVLACASCNLRKHQLSAQDFLLKLASNHG